MPGTQPTANVREGGFEQMDYLTISQELKNVVSNAKSMRDECLQTNHYPVTARIQARFRKRKAKGNTPAQRYDYKQFELNPDGMNKYFHNHITQTNNINYKAWVDT